MMIYDGPTTYTKEGFTKGFEKNKLYFVAYLDSNNKLNTKQVYVESIYSESIPGPGYISGSRNNLWWHAKLIIPYSHYKTFLHKWFDKPTITYKLLNEYIALDFIKTTELEAKIAFINILRKSNTKLKPIINLLDDEYADKYPDVYLSKMLNYKGLSSSHAPKYQSCFNKSYSK